ncbi:MAG: extracellular solute-binding protein [Leptospiraceae bacterium]|nr:extracellular solute-binding protein [Leptospiraceae bacterium]MDW8305552.1 extracellular solute-binding protein [Leptospiraceae bacterium]
MRNWVGHFFNLPSSWKLVLLTCWVLVLSFCQSPEDEKRIVLWHSYRGEERAALEEIVAKYNESDPLLKVKLLYIPTDAFADKLTNSIPRGKGPDIFIFAHDRIGDWAQKLLIEPLEFLMTDEFRDRFLEATLQSFIYRDEGLSRFVFEGSIYGLPLNFKVLALYYNRKFVLNPPKTTDELRELARRFTDRKKGVYGLVYPNDKLYFHSPWYFGFGAEIFDESGNVVLNSEGAARSMLFAKKLYQEDKIMPDEITSTLVTALFNDNRAVFVINGPWFKAEIREGLDYGIAVLPKISENKLSPARPFLTVEGVIMSAYSKKKKEAFAFMRYLTTKQSQLILARRGGQIPSLKEVYTESDIKNRNDLYVFKEQQTHSVPMPNRPDMKKIWTPMDNALSRVIYAGENPHTILQKVNKEVEEAIREGMY